jgi:transposase
VHLSCGRDAKPFSLHLSAGQASDSRHLESTLDAIRLPHPGRGRPRKRPDRCTTDKGYSYARCREALRRRKIKGLIPERADQRKRRLAKGRRGGRPVAFERERYKMRNLIERCILRLKQFRRFATRYEKRAESYLAVATIAAIFVWIR